MLRSIRVPTTQLLVALGAAVLFAQWWRRRRRSAAAPTLLSLGADKAAAAAAAAAADAGAGAEPLSTRTELSSPRSAAGHAGNIESDGFFFKLENTATPSRYEYELAMLERLRQSSADDPMSVCAPEFFGVVTIDGKRYLKMRSLLSEFDASTLCVMDVKMGVRCFDESELKSTKPRSDLYERLLKLKPEAVTEDERASGSITKARWMRVRDSLSSTVSLGFRVDGIDTPTVKRKSAGDLAMVRKESDIVQALRSFLPAAPPRAAALGIQARLAEIEDRLRRSAIFRSSEVIGSSLLFAADGSGRSGVWMIDFGLTAPSPVGQLQHTVPWEDGTHEDGYLLGLGNLQRLWAELLASG